MTIANISDLVGKTFVSVVNANDEAIVFKFIDGSGYSMHHNQDCCECVSVEDIVGDLKDLEDTEILQATEDSNSGDGEREGSSYGSHTWTFYNFRTIKGSVTIRWYGSSNGYYSESVNIYAIS